MLNKIAVGFRAQKAHKYNIWLGSAQIDNWREWLPQHAENKRIIIITDTLVHKLHAEKFADGLINNGYNVLTLTVEPGEESKSNATKEYLELEMLKEKCDRHTLCLAFGGGVIGDLAGFVSATYMRGIKYIQIPTTMLAMTDSSIGGKTAINTTYGKNLIGAIWQPQEVIADLNLLLSLPKIQLINGLIEAVKIFITLDSKSFNYTKNNLHKILAKNEKCLQSVIKRAVRLKAWVVKNDEREENLRMILNFGHTIGHAIERASNYQILHGYCVALGILVESKIAVLMGHLSEDDYGVISDLLKNLGINKEMLAEFDVDEVIKNMLVDKKNKNGEIYCVIIKNIGEVYVENERIATVITDVVIHKAFTALR